MVETNTVRVKMLKYRPSQRLNRVSVGWTTTPQRHTQHVKSGRLSTLTHQELMEAHTNTTFSDTYRK